MYVTLSSMKGEPLPFCSTAPFAERFYTVAATIYVKMLYPVHNITTVILSINLSNCPSGLHDYVLQQNCIAHHRGIDAGARSPRCPC